MLLPQRGSDFDFGDFIQGALKFIVFGFLFVLPVIKSILEARKQRAEQERKRSWTQPVEEAEEDIEVDYSHDDLEIGFNVSYLLDVLGVLKSQSVRMELSDSNSSCVLYAPEDMRARYVVMPMRL